MMSFMIAIMAFASSIVAWEQRQEVANIDALVTVASVDDHSTIDRYRGYINNAKRAKCWVCKFAKIVE